MNALILNGKKAHYKKNKIIVYEGDCSESAYIIHSGKVKIFLCDNHGKEIVLMELTEGDYFGEMSLIDRKERSATAMVTEDATLTAITSNDFRKCIQSNQAICDQILLGLVTNLRKANQKISSLVFTGAFTRVMNMLLELAKEKDGRLIIEKKPTQQHIANVVGASREMISRILKNMVDERQISIAGKQIEIHRKLKMKQTNTSKKPRS